MGRVDCCGAVRRCPSRSLSGARAESKDVRFIAAALDVNVERAKKVAQALRAKPGAVVCIGVRGERPQIIYHAFGRRVRSMRTHCCARRSRQVAAVAAAVPIGRRAACRQMTRSSAAMEAAGAFWQAANKGSEV